VTLSCLLKEAKYLEVLFSSYSSDIDIAIAYKDDNYKQCSFLNDSTTSIIPHYNIITIVIVIVIVIVIIIIIIKTFLCEQVKEP